MSACPPWTMLIEGRSLRVVGPARNDHPVLLLIHDLDITAIHATTGELIRQLTLKTDHDYQPQNSTKPPNP